MIEAEGLTRTFGPIVAVEDVSFKVQPGEIMGLLGPNGAGKTTILRMLSTQIVPVSGTARIAGADILTSPQQVRENLGYLPEVAPLYDDMEVGEYLSFAAEGHGLAGARKHERLDWVASACALEKVWYQPISQLSKGYRQRVGLAQALIHDPPCLILDEPTSGLDPLQILEIRRLIKELSKDKAIIFSTHILQEVEALADWVTILNQGRVVAQGRFEELAATVSQEVSLLLRLDRALTNWQGLSGVKVEELGSRAGAWVYRLQGAPGFEAKLHGFLCEAGAVPLALERENEDLERVFLKLVEKKEATYGRA